MSAAGRETKGAAPRELCALQLRVEFNVYWHSPSPARSPRLAALSLASRADGVPRRREGFPKKETSSALKHRRLAS